MNHLLTRSPRVDVTPSAARVGPTPARHHPRARRPRWRRASTAVSWLLVACATAGALHLGLGAPSVSTVTAPPASVVVADPVAPAVPAAPDGGRAGRGPGGRRG